jgi:hypothetical protein
VGSRSSSAVSLDWVSLDECGIRWEVGVPEVSITSSKLLLVLASTVFPSSDSRRTHDHVLLSHDSGRERRAHILTMRSDHATVLICHVQFNVIVWQRISRDMKNALCCHLFAAFRLSLQNVRNHCLDIVNYNILCTNILLAVNSAVAAAILHR